MSFSDIFTKEPEEKTSLFTDLPDGFSRINELLIYDNKTKIVYYNYGIRDIFNYAYGFMALYLSENGSPCRYEDGNIKEVTTSVSPKVK